MNPELLEILSSLPPAEPPPNWRLTPTERATFRAGYHRAITDALELKELRDAPHP